jgi:hypothetical protein
MCTALSQRRRDQREGFEVVVAELALAAETAQEPSSAPMRSARLLDEAAAVPDAKGLLLTFDDFLIGRISSASAPSR